MSDPTLIDDPQFSRFLLERLGQAAAVVLDRAATIQYLSKRAQRLLNATQRKIPSRDFFDVVSLCDDQDQVLPERKNPVWQALHSRNYNQVTPFFCRLARSGPALPLAVKALQIKQGRRITGVIVELREVKRVLNVGEMKSLFVSFAAHQLKTPSSVVKGFLELMMREGESAYQKQQWYNLQSAFEANENLIHLSKTLLNLTRLEGGLIEPNLLPFDPFGVLEQKINSHKLLLKVKQISVRFKREPGSFLSDELFFSEIFEILFSNAIKHSPAGSAITVRCDVKSSHVEVSVADEGPGVPAEVRDQLFTTASETDPDHNRHGLGLLMARKYATLLGGSIGLKTSPPRGAEFYFSIPKPIV